MSYSYTKSFNALMLTLTKEERRDYKLEQIAEVDRQEVGTPSYRPLNQYSSPGTYSPAVGHPWTLDPGWDNTSGIGENAIVSVPELIELALETNNILGTEDGNSLGSQ
jgi:hypothetical protein